MERKRIGDYFVEKGILTEKDKHHILSVANQSGKSFGETVLDLGLVTRKDMVKVFGPNFEIDFFYLDSKYFPMITKSVLEIEQMLKYGCMPLGLKKKEGFLSRSKSLNLGFLNPSNRNSVNEIEKIALKKLASHHVSDTKIYLILADQFIEVIREVYGFNLSHDSSNHKELDEILKLFLDR
jgi:hypothetical protein